MSVDDGLTGPGDPHDPGDGSGHDLTPDLALVEVDERGRLSEPAEQPAEQPAGSTGGGAESEEPHFANVYVFVTRYLAHVYARRGAERDESSVSWCGQWWAHPEALGRLEALWQAFEVLRREPGTGAASWWRDYADPTMSVLLSPTGPFSGCGPEKHRPPVPLPSAEIPEALLHDNDPHRTEDLQEDQ